MKPAARRAAVEAKMRRSTTSFPVYPLSARVCRGSLPTSERLRTMKSKRQIRRIVVLALSLLYAGRLRAEDTFHLPIGDPARRDREAPVVLDALTDTSKGDPITPLDLPARLAGVRLLFLGESHTSMDSHRVEKRVIEALHASGRKVAIGLEMFPYTEQKSLDEWVGSSLDERRFWSGRAGTSIGATTGATTARSFSSRGKTAFRFSRSTPRARSSRRCARKASRVSPRKSRRMSPPALTRTARSTCGFLRRPSRRKGSTRR